MIKLFSFWRSLATYRVRIALNLKGLRPEQVPVHLRNDQQRTPDYLAHNPQGLVPALEIDGLTSWQSVVYAGDGVTGGDLIVGTIDGGDIHLVRLASDGRSAK